MTFDLALTVARERRSHVNEGAPARRVFHPGIAILEQSVSGIDEVGLYHAFAKIGNVSASVGGCHDREGLAITTLTASPC